MPSPVEPELIPSPDIQIPLTNVVRFLRQLIHDLRNHLNAAELQSAYLAEIAESAESKDEVKRLRAMISELSTSLQKVSTALSDPRLTRMPYAAADFLEDLQRKVATDHPDEEARIEWSFRANDAKLEIDPQALLSAMTELFGNAFLHDSGKGTISVEARIEGDRFLLTIREPKQGFAGSTENWGRKPLQSVGKAHYGLGLHRSRVIIEAHGGQLTARYDSPASSLITTVALPLAN